MALTDELAGEREDGRRLDLVLKPLGGRRRPNRDTNNVPVARQVPMPETTSFPSGHAASAFAFASGASFALPAVGFPLNLAAAVVAYSRVHTGVHYLGRRRRSGGRGRARADRRRGATGSPAADGGSRAITQT